VDRRIDTLGRLGKEIERNVKKKTVEWQFTVAHI
jgi:hypothetical protein